MAKNSSYDAFISYKSEDLPFAQALYEQLTKAGLRVWFDKVRLQPGYSWHKDIEEGCESSRVLLPVLTPSWQTSEWTKFETYGAEAIIPLHFNGQWDDVAPPPLHGYQSSAIDFTNIEETDWKQLIDSIRDILAQSPPQKVDRLATVKFRPNPNFVGRENDLNRINEALHRKPDTRFSQGSVYALSAMGGIGKTTLARQYVEKFWRLYSQIFWVDARSDPSNGFATIALILFPHLTNHQKETLAQRALQVLSDGTSRLLILDDVQDEESIQSWIPKSGGCHTIITSRFAGWSASVENIPIYLLDPAHSCELLLRRARRDDIPENREACKRLAKTLGYLPLALEQAAAFINQEGPDFDFDDYLHIYQRSSKDLLAKKSLGSTEYPDSVITTWKTTLTKLSWISRAVLRMASFLSSSPIPKVILTKSSETILDLAVSMSISDTGTPCVVSDSQPPAETIREAVRELSRYSMITSHGHEITVHPLVQAVERLESSGSDFNYIVANSIRVVRTARPIDIADVSLWNDWNLWLPHAEEVIENAEAENVRAGIGELYGWAGAWYEHIADYSKAEYLLKKILDLDETRLGGNSLIVAARLNKLAGVIMARGRKNEAEEHFQRALDIVEPHGDKDPGLLCRILNNIGMLYKSTGRLREAEDLFVRALKVSSNGPEALGDSKSVFLTNLASVHLMTNRLESAEEYFNKALELDRIALGEGHPAVAKSLINLAELFTATNRLPEAADICSRALAITESAFGKDHPETALCLNELGRIYHDMDRFSEAESLFKKALEIDLVTYGPDHAKVAIRHNNLAGVYMKTGRLAEAEEIMRQSLNIRERSLGPKNPLTYHLYCRLATVLLQRDKLDEAEELANRSVGCWLKSETPRSFKSGRAHRILALIKNRKGEAPKAKKLMIEAVSIYEETLVHDDHRLETIRKELSDLSIQQ